MTQGEVRLQQLGPKPLSGDFDLLGEAYLLRTRQKRYLAHLCEVHPDRIVYPSCGRLHLHRDLHRAPAGASLHFRLIHEVNPHLVQLHEDLVYLFR